MKKLLIAVLMTWSALTVVSAPFKCDLSVTNSKGKELTIQGEGDEFDAVFEKDGYTVLAKPNTAFYFYAIKDGDALKLSDVEIGEETATIPSSLEKHLRDTSTKHDEEVQTRVNKDEEENHTQENWEELKKQTDVVEEEVVEEEAEEKGWFWKCIDWICSLFCSTETANVKTPLGAPPKTPTVGQVIGLTIMVDFPTKSGSSTTAKTVHPDIKKKNICDMLNADEYKEFYNKDSVRSFYKKISHNHLDLTNSVIDYVLLPHPRSYYDDVTVDCGQNARKLIADMWNVIKKLPNYQTEIIPLIQDVSYDAKTKRFRSLSILFAGNYPSKWCYGLWPHKSATTSPSFVMKDGKTKCRFSTYQISPITTNPYISTFCHECGHMVCAFPDLYDYTHKSKGAGYYSMMASGDIIDPYLAEAAGWITPIEMPEQGELVLPYDRKTVYKFMNPDNVKEYYLVENRQKKDLDYDYPGSGIMIWRCNRGGTNKSGGSYKGKGDNKWRRNYELSIVQADGQYDLERNSNSGRADDLWSADNTCETYPGEANDTTVPNLVWANNKVSGLRLSKFSKCGDTMTCWVGPDELMPHVKATAEGYSGKRDGKTHRITVKVTSPTKGVVITYSKEQFGKYARSNPGYAKEGTYTTWYKCTANGYISAKGSATVTILPKK